MKKKEELTEQEKIELQNYIGMTVQKLNPLIQEVTIRKGGYTAILNNMRVNDILPTH